MITDIKQYIKDKLIASDIEYSFDPIQVEGKYYYLYLTINQINQRYYIGIHSCNKPHDKWYKGSGKALRDAKAKYGYNILYNEPIAYFKSKLDLEYAESVVVTDELVGQESGKIYNMKSGGITDSTNLQHSQFMKEKMKDPEYMDYWLERIQYYKDHPEEAAKKHYVETKEDRKERYRLVAQKNSERLQQEKKTNPEKIKLQIQHMHQAAIEAKRKIIIVEHKQTNEKNEFNNQEEAAKFLNTTKAIVRGLIRSRSQNTELGQQYKVYYKDPKHQQQVKMFQYADPYSKCEGVIAYDQLGNEVKRFNSIREANEFVGADPNYGLGTAIKKHYLSHGYYWEYADKEKQSLVTKKEEHMFKTQHIKLVNPQTNQVLKHFNSFAEAVREFKTDRQTIKKYMESGEEFKGYIWQADGKHKSVDHRPEEMKLKFMKPVGGSIERNGEIVIQYSSAQEASKQLNKCPSAISSAIRTGHRCSNYYWRYLTNEEKSSS